MQGRSYDVTIVTKSMRSATTRPFAVISKRQMAEEMAQNVALASQRTSRRGGKRQGAGRKKQADRDNDVRIRISEGQHLRWNEVKTL